MHLFAILSLTMSSTPEALLTTGFGLALLALAFGVRHIEASHSKPVEKDSSKENLDVSLGTMYRFPVVSSPEGLHQVAAHLHTKSEPAGVARFV